MCSELFGTISGDIQYVKQTKNIYRGTLQTLLSLCPIWFCYDSALVDFSSWVWQCKALSPWGFFFFFFLYIFFFFFCTAALEHKLKPTSAAVLQGCLWYNTDEQYTLNKRLEGTSSSSLFCLLMSISGWWWSFFYLSQLLALHHITSLPPHPPPSIGFRGTRRLSSHVSQFVRDSESLYFVLCCLKYRRSHLK